MALLGRLLLLPNLQILLGLREGEQQLNELNYSVIDIWRLHRSVTSSVPHFSSYQKFQNLSKSSESLTARVEFLPL